VVLAPQIIHLVAGHSFDGSITPLRVLLVAAALSWVNGVFGYALIAKERQATALWLNVTALIVNVGLNLALVPAYGIVAAAVVTVASEILILAASRPLMRQHLGFFPRPGTLGAAVVAASAMAAVLWPLRHGPLAALLPLGVVLYMGLVYAISPTSRAALAGLRGQA
jgi:O-antigen/teichoic acid export membrane protein